jgi:aminomethyltransferase
MRRSPLDDRHRQLGATMTDFGGWEMPLDYGSVVAEHRAVREACGAFDLSHLGTLRVTGPAATAAVQCAFTNDASVLQVGRAHYTLCLSDDGGILDDLLVYRVGDGDVLVVPNAANTPGVLEVLRRCAQGLDCEVADVKESLAVLAVQGPRSAEAVAMVGIDVGDLAYLDCRPFPRGDGVVARSGYTGEVGFELFAPVTEAPNLWDRLVEADVTPAGLGARDTLRLEMGYPLHGNDISPATSPLEAGLRWAVKPDHDFVGREAYLRAVDARPLRRLRGLRVPGRGIPRAHCSVSAEGKPVGETTSGTFSPTLRVGIALAYLSPEVSEGDMVEIDVRGKAVPAQVVRPPFVEASPK